jgi:hypothetical protein
MPEMIYETNLRLLQESADYTAKSIVGRLDKSLNPAVAFVVVDPNLLIGTGAIDASTLKEHTAVFGNLDPYIVEQGFSGFRRTLEKTEDALARQDSALKAPFNWYKQRAEKQMSIGYTLEAIFNDADAAKNRIYFADRAVYREDDRVFVCAIVRLDRKSYESHYRLSIPITLNDASTSLLDLTINQLLQACFIALRSRNADTYEFLNYARNVLTDSARAMVAFRFPRRTRSRQPTKLDLFGDCNAIAALPYESKGGKGKLLVAERRHPNIETEIHFRNAISLSDHQMTRKMLEMAQGDSCLLSDTRQVYGLGTVSGIYDQTKEDLFVIEFIKQHSWRLLHAQHELMTVTLGRPKLALPIISEVAFRQHFYGHVDRRKTASLELLYEIIKTTAALQHGALLVISNKAEQEAKRLGGQAVRVKPFLLRVENVPRLTAIDGAVLIDSSGLCHAVGVILDGQAVKTGNPSRGSRFNSALRYILTARKRGDKCIGVVVSEDGMINLL